MSTPPYNPANPPLVNADTEYTLLFPVVPLQQDPSPPDATNLAYVDDISDFSEDAAQTDVGDPTSVPPLGVKNLAYDWDRDELYQGASGAPLIVEDEDAIIEECLLTMNIPRGVYPIFSRQFGNRVLDMVGSGLQDETLYSEVSRGLTASLSSIELVTSVTVVAMRRLTELDPTSILCTVSVATVYSDQPLMLDLRT